jgi:hypothetical protein
MSSRKGSRRGKKGGVCEGLGGISETRKRLWFEKFYWFVSSSGLLVLGGRDARQNELLVKRYLRRSDLYLHADVHGASSVVIRNDAGGTRFTCFTSTKVQILTPEELRARASRCIDGRGGSSNGSGAIECLGQQQRRSYRRLLGVRSASVETGRDWRVPLAWWFHDSRD